MLTELETVELGEAFVIGSHPTFYKLLRIDGEWATFEKQGPFSDVIDVNRQYTPPKEILKVRSYSMLLPWLKYKASKVLSEVEEFAGESPAIDKKLTEAEEIKYSIGNTKAPAEARRLYRTLHNLCQPIPRMAVDHSAARAEEAYERLRQYKGVSHAVDRTLRGVETRKQYARLELAKHKVFRDYGKVRSHYKSIEGSISMIFAETIIARASEYAGQIPAVSQKLEEAKKAWILTERARKDRDHTRAWLLLRSTASICEEIAPQLLDTPKQKKTSVSVTLGTDVAMDFVLIPSGKFVTGSMISEGERRTDEGPRHEVTISKPFYMGIDEVTQAQYRAVMGKNPSKFKGDNNPVEQVSWKDAVEFCRKLSRKEGKTYRLPTEAEWEYACRVGTPTPFNTGTTISADRANYNGNYSYGRKGFYMKETTAAKSFRLNARGLYDMHGNVWEWCSNDYGSDANVRTTDAQRPSSSSYRVLRGGCWNIYPWNSRSADRIKSNPSNSYDYGGFRVVLVAE